MEMAFEWDEPKNQQNRRKHAVSFEEARSLFTSGGDYLEIFDVEHSLDEEIVSFASDRLRRVSS